MARNAIHIGTSGWHYQSWRGPFFPRELMIKHQLRYYGTQFDTTELNGVFYRTPTLQAVRGWAEQTPDDFHFLLEGIEIHHALETPQTEKSKSSRSS